MQRSNKYTYEDNDWPWESDKNDPRSSIPVSQRRIERFPSETNQKQGVVSIDKLFVQEMLQVHNEHRELHQAPPLKLDSNLIRSAQEWAEAIARRDKLEPDVDCKLENIGENLAMMYHSDKTAFSGAEVTNYWYSGIEQYDFDESKPKPGRDSAPLLFSQVVWKASELAGFGKAKSHRGKVYIVGRYYPCGNVAERFKENVLPKKQDSVPNKDLVQQPSGSSIKPKHRSTSPSESSEFRKYRQDELSDSRNHRQEDGLSDSRKYRQDELSDSRKYRKNESPEDRKFRMNESPEVGKSRMNGATERRVIGAISPSDKLISTQERTVVENNRTTVTIEEKYTSESGNTYTRRRNITYYGANYDGH